MEYYIWNVINRTLLTEFMYETLYGTLYKERFVQNVINRTLNTEL